MAVKQYEAVCRIMRKLITKWQAGLQLEVWNEVSNQHHRKPSQLHTLHKRKRNNGKEGLTEAEIIKLMHLIDNWMTSSSSVREDLSSIVIPISRGSRHYFHTLTPSSLERSLQKRWKLIWWELLRTIIYLK